MNFEYHDVFNGDYKKYLESKATDCLCKHICRSTSEKAKAVAAASEKIGYLKAWWGYGEGLYKDPELNRTIQLNRVQVFIYDAHIHPIRLVIDKDGDLWIDNLHNILAQILCHGYDTLLKYLPVYIVDMRYDVPKIVDGNHLIEFDYDKIRGLITAAENRCNRVSSEIKSIGYTIGDFMDDNDVSKGALTLPSSTFYSKFLIASEQFVL